MDGYTMLMNWITHYYYYTMYSQIDLWIQHANNNFSRIAN